MAYLVDSSHSLDSQVRGLQLYLVQCEIAGLRPLTVASLDRIVLPRAFQRR